MVEEGYFDDLDRKFFNLSSGMADVFSRTYGMIGYRLIAPLDPNKFDNAASKAKELGIRTLILFGTLSGFLFLGAYLFIGGLVLGIGSRISKSIALYFQRGGFTLIRGGKPEIKMGENGLKAMVWSICGQGGGLHYVEGGVIHWRSRVDRIADSIKKEDPDVLVLQDVYDAAFTEALLERLGYRYSKIYGYVENHCVAFVKCAVQSFRYTPFSMSDSKTKRGFQIIEIKANPEDSFPSARIIATQLSPGKEHQKLRMKQLSEIMDSLAEEKVAVPTLFIGNMNIDRDSETEGALLSKYLSHSYQGKDPTHSGALPKQWDPILDEGEEASDFISVLKREPAGDGRIFPVVEKGVHLLDSHLGDGFDETHNTKEALSNRRAVLATISGLRAISF